MIHSYQKCKPITQWLHCIDIRFQNLLTVDSKVTLEEEKRHYVKEKRHVVVEQKLSELKAGLALVKSLETYPYNVFGCIAIPRRADSNHAPSLHE